MSGMPMQDSQGKSKRKKIAIVNVFFPPQAIGGATRVVTDNVDVLTQKYAEDFELVFFTSDMGQQASHTLYPYAYEGMRVYRAGSVWRPHMDWHAKDPAMGKLFGQFLDFEKPDLVHFHCIQRLTGSIVEATLERSIPYLVTVHDAWWISDFQFLVDANDKVYPEGHPDPFEEIEPPEGITLDDSLSRRSYLKGLLNQAEQVLVVSQAFAEIYDKNGIERIAVNKNGIKPRHWLPRQPSASGRLRLAHIGGMSSHKGYHLFKEVLSNYPFENLEALVVDHGAPAGYQSQDYWGTVPVTFVGKTSQYEIEKLYARMDVLVAPSIWPESYGLVTREAAAAGVWVIASSMGGIGEDILEDKNGWKISSNVLDLKNAFARLEMDKDTYKAEHLFTKVRNAEMQVDELVKIYNEFEI
jgi:glycosyltransferase involved in cell wall biosynthesis